MSLHRGLAIRSLEDMGFACALERFVPAPITWRWRVPLVRGSPRIADLVRELVVLADARQLVAARDAPLEVPGDLVRRHVAGRHLRRWDGLDQSGRQARPGIYICRVEAETAEGRQQRSGVVTVAY